MLSGTQKERTKRHHHKTRTGCLSCKARHFKCDERKPSCLRCILAAKECEYNIPRTRSFPSATPTSSEVSVSPPPNAVESLVPVDSREQRALLFFHEKTIPALTGFTSYTEIFWVSLIPQLCQSEVAIRHIVIALATKHEAVTIASENSEEMSLYWTKQHSLALAALTQQSSPPNPEILLVSCIAFVAFERLQDPTGLDERYLDYVISGLKILKERSLAKPGGEPSEFNLIDNFIEPMFFQIELCFGMFSQPDRLISSSAQLFQVPSPEIPERFTSLENAGNLFFQICAWRFTLSHGGRPWSRTSASFQEIRLLMVKWQNSLDAYLAHVPPDDTQELGRAHALRQQIQLLVGAMLYSAREDATPYCCSRPEVVDLSIPSKILIFIRIHGDRKINLTGINAGRPAKLKESGIWMWPHAKRIAVQGGEDLISLEFTAPEPEQGRQQSDNTRDMERST